MARTDRSWSPGDADLDWIEDTAGAPHPVLLEMEAAAGPEGIPILNRDSGRVEKAVAAPVLFFVSASPDGAWLIARVATGETGSSQTTVAFPAAGGSAVPVCDTCVVDWTPSTRSLIVRLDDERQSGRTFVIGLKIPGTLPRLPSGGMHTRTDVGGLALAHPLDGYVYPGSDEAPRYAFRRGTVRRNIYRVPLP